MKLLPHEAQTYIWFVITNFRFDNKQICGFAITLSKSMTTFFSPNGYHDYNNDKICRFQNYKIERVVRFVFTYYGTLRLSLRHEPKSIF